MSQIYFATAQKYFTATVIDEKPSVEVKPKNRKYRGVYLQNNKPFGQDSSIITISATP